MSLSAAPGKSLSSGGARSAVLGKSASTDKSSAAKKSSSAKSLGSSAKLGKALGSQDGAKAGGGGAGDAKGEESGDAGAVKTDVVKPKGPQGAKQNNGKSAGGGGKAGGGGGGGGGKAKPAKKSPPAKVKVKIVSIAHALSQGNKAAGPTDFGTEYYEPEVTSSPYKIVKSKANVTLNLAVKCPFGVQNLGRKDVPSATAGVVTTAKHPTSGKKVWETIRDSLKPGSAKPYNSLQTHYWSKALTIRHEKFHGTDDYKWTKKKGLAILKKELNNIELNTATAAAELATHIGTAIKKLIAENFKWYSGGKPYWQRPGEVRAYADGKPHYKKLAKGVEKQGKKLEKEEQKATATKFGIKPHNVRAYDKMSKAELIKEATLPYLYKSGKLYVGCKKYLCHLLETKFKDKGEADRIRAAKSNK